MVELNSSPAVEDARGLPDSLCLSLVKGIGPRTRQLLLARFGSAGAVLTARINELRTVERVGSELARRIARAREDIDADSEIQVCQAEGILIQQECDDDYPSMLRELPDPPGILFIKPRILEQDRLAIAIVGARHASRYGTEQAERLAGALARVGFTIVSGLARGIDAAAHRGALAAGGRTIGVLGGGLLRLYPPEHQELAQQVVAQGALVSEMPPRLPPMSGSFPQRNRIISGLALGVVVVEASEKSGALITARHAMEQNREVFAVPGRVDSRTSRGCHRLIRDGAKLVEDVDDILQEIGPLIKKTPTADGEREIRHPAELGLNDVEQKVLEAVTLEPVFIDQVIVATGLPAPQVLSTLSILEMKRLLRRQGGNRIMRIG